MPASLKSVVPERWFNRLVVGAVGFGFLMLIGSAILAAVATQRTQRHSHWVAHTYEVQREIAGLYSQQLRREAARRGYMLRGDPRILKAYREASAGVAPGLARIEALTLDNPVQRRNVASLQSLFARYTAAIDRSVALSGAGRRPQAIAEFSRDGSLELVLTIRDEVQRMTAEEQRLLVARDARQARSIRLFYASVALALALLVIVATATIWVILRYTRDLSESRNALRSLNEDLEGAVRERTTDLQRANDEIQRFAYIVSHDLRSPLVNVMGFTAELEASTKSLSRLIDRAEVEAPNLVDSNARLAAREDLPEAIGFIRTSTQKMDRLINAILRLSREGRRSITPERLDMTAVAQGVVDNLRHRADELGVDIAIEGPLPAIRSDRLAVEQVLSNLVENAVKYLQPGRPGVIRIRGRREGKRVILEVADNGRGIDPRDHDRVFDLFRRSGMQDQPGEGIGLAHARALTYRLGGVLGLESALGEGATFRMNMPAAYTGEGITS